MARRAGAHVAHAGRTAWAVLLLLALACAEDAGEPRPRPEGPLGEAPAGASAGETADGSPNARRALHRSLAEDREAERHASDGGGRAWLASGPRSEASELVAGGTGRFEIVYEAGPHGIAEGGSLFLQVPPFWGWSPPQTADPRLPGYTDVSTGAEGVALAPGRVEQTLLRVEVRGRPLREGEQVRFVYGVGAAGARVDRYAEREERFHLAVDGDGDGVRAFLEDAPAVEIAPGPPARLVVHLPATARPGETVPLTAALLDARASAGIREAWTLRLDLPEGVEGPRRVEVPAEAAGRTVVPLRVAARDAPLRLRARAEGPAALEAISNPLSVEAEGPRVLFADLHGHSGLSDGTGTPEDYYRYARDVAGLDVAALTDHDHWGIPFLDASPQAWARIEEAARRFHEPGRFVTILGYEWTSWLHGHRHVLHFGDEATLRSSVDERFETPRELWDALRGQPALTFAHHSAGDPVATDWSFPPDPELEPVTEVVSVHGSSEAPDAPVPVRGGIPGNWVRDVLTRGFRLGLIGSGDSHDGHPGLAHLDAPSGGLAGILAGSRTREAVLEALRARRTFATNGPRIVLRAWLDGRPMGSALPAAGTHRLRVRALGTAPIEAVELVLARGGVVDRVPGEGRRELAFETELAASGDRAVLYLRLLQEDGGAAWTSPFFLGREAGAGR